MTRFGYFMAGLAAITIGTIGNASAADWEDVEFYPFEEATLTYTVTGMQAGSQVQIIMESGRKTASLMDTQMNMFGVNQATKTGSWTTKDWVYTWDYNTGQGTKMANPMKDLMANIDDPQQAYMQFLTGFGATQEGTDTHNGTPCNVWKLAMAGTTLCISEDLIMQYTRMNMMGMAQDIELVETVIGPVSDDLRNRPEGTYNEVQLPPGMFGN